MKNLKHLAKYLFIIVLVTLNSTQICLGEGDAPLFSNLPLEIQINIFRYLSSNELGNLSLTNQAFNQLLNNEETLKEVFKRQSSEWLTSFLAQNICLPEQEKKIKLAKMVLNALVRKENAIGDIDLKLNLNPEDLSKLNERGIVLEEFNGKHIGVLDLALRCRNRKLVDYMIALEMRLPRTYLKEVYQEEDLLDRVGILKNPELFHYIVELSSKLIREMGAHYIASPEARSLPYMGAISEKTGIPALFVRKGPKLKGPKVSVETYRGYTLELSQDKGYVGKKVVILDDGLASGMTLSDTDRLLKKAGLSVAGVIAIVHYPKRKKTSFFDKAFAKVFNSDKHTFFDLDASDETE